VSSYENVYELLTEAQKRRLYEVVMQTYRNGVEYGAWIFATLLGSMPTVVFMGKVYEGKPQSVSLDFSEIEGAPAVIADFHTHPLGTADVPGVQDMKFTCYTAFYYDRRDAYYSKIIGMPLDERRAVISYYTVKPQYRSKMHMCWKVCSGLQEMTEMKYNELDVIAYILDVTIPTAYTVVRATHEDGREVEVEKPEIIYVRREALYGLIGEGQET
jgi:hypothetical protein